LKDAPFATLGFSGAIIGAPPSSRQRPKRRTGAVGADSATLHSFALTSRLNISKLDLKIAEYRLEETRLNVIRMSGMLFCKPSWATNSWRWPGRTSAAWKCSAATPKRTSSRVGGQNDVLKAEVALAQARQRERSAAKQLVLLRSRLNQLFDLDLQTRLDLAETSWHPS